MNRVIKLEVYATEPNGETPPKPYYVTSTNTLYLDEGTLWTPSVGVNLIDPATLTGDSRGESVIEMVKAFTELAKAMK